VLQCPENGSRLTFQIKPRALEDSITVELEVDCNCSCEQAGSEVYFISLNPRKYRIYIVVFGVMEV
jgi:hypothetical protein